MKTLQERFNEKYTPEPMSGCWLWTAACYGPGYGHMRVDADVVGSHRVSWSLHKGPIPEGMWVLHKCDIPSCVNPDHLFLGTHTDNMTDMKLKGRALGASKNVGAAHGRAKLNDDDVRKIRTHLKSQRLTQTAIADKFGVSQKLVSAIKMGVCWSHLPD